MNVSQEKPGRKKIVQHEHKDKLRIKFSVKLKVVFKRMFSKINLFKLTLKLMLCSVTTVSTERCAIKSHTAISRYRLSQR